MSVGLKDRRRSLDDSLKALILELQADAAQDLHTSVKKASSYVHLKSLEDYQRDRQCYLQTLLQVPQARPLELQCDVLREECGNVCRKSEYTPENLPLLLHQFYCDRVSQLVQLKHMHLVRWARFAVRKPRIAEDLLLEHRRRMGWIMQEYNHALNAARRLAAAHDHMLANKPPPANLILAEDVTVYIRWLVFNQHVLKNVTAFVTTIRWLPLLYQQELTSSIITTTTATPSHQSTSGVQAIPTAHSKCPLQKKPRPLLPRHTVDVSEIALCLEELKLAYSISGPSNPSTPSDHLQLYYHSSRKFHDVFECQEQQAVLHTYDKPVGAESIPVASRSKLTFRKPSNWTSFIKMKPRPDPVQVKGIVKMKEKTVDLDNLLQLSSHCTHLHNIHRALYALKQHMAAVRHPTTVTPICVSSHKTPHSTLLVWRCIYSGLDTRNPINMEEAPEPSDTDEGMETGSGGLGTGHGGLGTSDGSLGTNPVSGEHNIGISEAMKLIHAEDGRVISAQAHSTPKDGYFAYVLLRHLRIRDCRAKCLEVLNYFRSVERTLTINCEGLSLESTEQKPGNLPDHRHLFRTPADYVVSQSEFMQFMEVENRDDYYSFEADGHIKVRDHRGVCVVYDVALEDLDSVEKELLLVGSYYIQHRGMAAKAKHGAHDSPLDIDAHQSVDCFAVLLDLWSCEEQFLEAKMKVVNCYMEAYHHVYDWREKQVMSKVITDLLWLRPRHDPSALYFTPAYHGECQCLASHLQLVHTITAYQLSEERTFTRAILQHLKEPLLGLPHPPVLKQPVSLTGDKSTLIQSYLLESCNSLSVIASVYSAVNWSLTEIFHIFDCSCVSEVIDVHCKVFELALQEWEQRESLGTSFTADVQKHLFADGTAEDPHRMVEVFLVVCDELRRNAAELRMDPKEQDVAQMKGWAKVLQLVTQRHHMLITCSECETLVRTYKLQLGHLDHEECHTHLRCVPFDFTTKFGANKDLEYFLNQGKEGSMQSRLDSYSPTKLHIAVHELDEKSFGNFSFCSKEGLLKILTSRSGLDDLKITLAVQVAYRNALLIACQQNSVVLSRSVTGDMVGTVAAPSSTLTGRKSSVDKKLASCFVSIQLEKSPVRDHMLAQFTSHPAAVVKNREDLEESKSKLLNQYCDNLMMSLSHYSMRGQLLRYYESLLKLLEDFPATRKAYFIVGGAPELGGLEASARSSHMKTTDSRQHQARLQMLLSVDGKKLLNLWYIPSTIQILTMFSDLPLEETLHAFTVALHLISSLHDILAYLCTYVKLGTAQGPSGGDRQFTGGWGGIERVGTEVQLLQNHIGQLGDPTDPWMVCEYLDYYRSILFLQHDIMVRHCLKRTFLLKDRTEAVQVLQQVSQEAQEGLRGSPSRHLSFLLYPTPSPLDLPTQKASSVFPWRAFFNSHGPFPTILQHCQDTPAYIYTSLAMLGPLDRSTANAEMLGLALLMEDVIHPHTTPRGHTHEGKGPNPYIPRVPISSTAPPGATGSSRLQATPTTRDHSGGVVITNRLQAPSRPPPASLAGSTRDLSASLSGSSQPSHLPPFQQTSLSGNTPLMDQAKLLQRFLVKMSQVEVLKHHWGLRVLGVVTVATQKQCLLLEEAYKEKVVGVAQKVVAKKQAMDAAKLQFDNESATGSVATFVTDTNFGSEEDGSELPEREDLNELLLREAQVKHLLQLLEQYLVDDTCKYLSKVHHLLMAERQRDDTTLPLDLWKRSSMKDIVGLPRPHIVEDFLLELKKQLTEVGDTFSIPKAHLATCLSQMSSGVLAREKECYDMYASYYEAILKSQYSQLYLKDQEVEHYQSLVEATAKRTKEEDLLFMAEHTHSLILEITALRTRVSQLEADLQSKEEDIRRRVLDEYTSLVDGMCTATMDIKRRFTDYRKSLYDDVVHSLYEVRQTAAESIGRMKDRLSAGSSGQDTGTIVHALKAEGCKEIQEENAALSCMMMKMRALTGWSKTRSQHLHNQELLSLSARLDSSRKECFALKMESEEEILSLQQQVQALQKSLGQMEAEYEVVKQSLEEEKQKKMNSGKSSSRAKENPMSRSEKSQSVKAEQLLQVLEEKDKVIQSLSASQDRARRQVAWDQGRTSKDLHKMKQQLGQERALKLEAFHQAEELMTQVHSYEAQHTSLMSSANNLHLTSMSTTSVPRRMAATRSSSPQLTRAPIPKAVTQGTSQGRPRTGSVEKGDMIDLSEEILALRLI